MQLFTPWITLFLLLCFRGIFNISQSFLFSSPVKFAGGDCWIRGPALVGSSGEQPMDLSTVEQMDTSGSNTTEASAPLPIRHPSGINAGLYKKQAYPMNSKRPEHLRMNLWRSACLQTIWLFQFHLFFPLSFSFRETLFLFFGKLTRSAAITSSSSHAFSSSESKVPLTTGLLSLLHLATVDIWSEEGVRGVLISETRFAH